MIWQSVCRHTLLARGECSDTAVRLQVVPSAWISLYSNCSTLFSPPSNCVLNGFTGSDCKRPQYQSNDLLVAQGGETYSVNSYQYDTGILDNNGPGWQTQFYVGEVWPESCLHAVLQSNVQPYYACAEQLLNSSALLVPVHAAEATVRCWVQCCYEAKASGEISHISHMVCLCFDLVASCISGMTTNMQVSHGTKWSICPMRVLSLHVQVLSKQQGRYARTGPQVSLTNKICMWLLQDADRRRRALMQVEDNEGGGGGSGLDAGCWPDFYDVSDFTQWLDGVYQGQSPLHCWPY